MYGSRRYAARLVGRVRQGLVAGTERSPGCLRDKGLVRARNSDRLQAALCSINDRVEISIRGSTLTKSALTLYGGPLALGLAFAMSQADSSDLFVAGAFFVGLAVGFMSLRWIDSRGLLGNTEPVLERLVETTVQPVMVVDPTQ